MSTARHWAIASSEVFGVVIERLTRIVTAEGALRPVLMKAQTGADPITECTILDQALQRLLLRCRAQQCRDVGGFGQAAGRLPQRAGHRRVFVAVASRDSEKAGKVAADYGCEAVTGYEKLLGMDLDAVYVPLPAAHHAVCYWPERSDEPVLTCETSLPAD